MVTLTVIFMIMISVRMALTNVKIMTLLTMTDVESDLVHAAKGTPVASTQIQKLRIEFYKS